MWSRIVRVEPDDYRYLTSYKGLAFYTRARAPLDLPAGTELVQARKIWVPGG
jgi:hypothetical protein